jgi:hypothetical protein
MEQETTAEEETAMAHHDTKFLQITLVKKIKQK